MKVTVRAGETFILPAGYFYAEYSPVNTIAFTGEVINRHDLDKHMRLVLKF